MSFAEHIAPILRTTLEVLHEAGRPLQPDEVRQAVTERISIAPEHQGPNAHGQTRWWAQLGFRTGEAASLGWMVKRNGWSITSAGIQALEDFPGLSSIGSWGVNTERGDYLRRAASMPIPVGTWC